MHCTRLVVALFLLTLAAPAGATAAKGPPVAALPRSSTPGDWLPDPPSRRSGQATRKQVSTGRRAEDPDEVLAPDGLPARAAGSASPTPVPASTTAQRNIDTSDPFQP